MLPSQGKERILAIGGYGAGKSFIWSKIADWNFKRDGGKLYVLDTDMAADRMSIAYPEAFDAKVVSYDLAEWADYTGSLAKAYSAGKPDDWLVVDMVDKAWDAVQAYYVDQIYSKSIDNYFMEARKRNVEGTALDGWTDWQFINKLYQAWIMKVLRWPGHVLCVAPAEPIVESGKNADSIELRNTFGRLGVKPKGQKALAFQFHTVLYLQQGKNGANDIWVMNTVKDRSREMLKKKEFTDFVASYLVPVAKWTL